MTDDQRANQEVRAYGSSHALARRLLLPAAGFLLLGLATVFSTAGIHLPGLALIAIGGVVLTVIAMRLSEPPAAAIEFGTDGIVFRDISTRLIPWREIRSVEISRVRERGAPVTREVATIAVSREFFATLSPKTIWPQEVVSLGDPTLIHLAYYRRDIAAQELAATIRAKLVDTSTEPWELHRPVPRELHNRLHRETVPSVANPGASAVMRLQRSGAIRSLLWGLLAVAVLIFIFGPVFGLRETGTQMRSRKIGEDHERRMRESLEQSDRARRKSEEDLARYRKELFGDR